MSYDLSPRTKNDYETEICHIENLISKFRNEEKSVADLLATLNDLVESLHRLEATQILNEG